MGVSHQAGRTAALKGQVAPVRAVGVGDAADLARTLIDGRQVRPMLGARLGLDRQTAHPASPVLDWCSAAEDRAYPHGRVRLSGLWRGHGAISSSPYKVAATVTSTCRNR